MDKENSSWNLDRKRKAGVTKDGKSYKFRLMESM